MKTTKITNKRELAIKLSNGLVNINNISKKLNSVVALWISRNEIVLENGYLKLV